MPNDNLKSSFPASRRDISNLRATALDAAKDIRSTASVHADKARGQFRDLAAHVQEEGGEQLDQVKGKLEDLMDAARTYASARPLASMAAALAIGFVIGTMRKGWSSQD